MIARIWKGRTKNDVAEEYEQYLNETGVKDCRKTEGNRGVYVFRKIAPEYAEFCFISLWESEQHIREFSGDDINNAVYYPRDPEYLLELPPHVEHFEVLIAG
jgi:heme-degrading monooxygenase HmoA